ncbi:UNVERIFIED_CONTAM: hypothetical protein PYX00_008538 [Menopon gallinae]|uniref:Peroxidase n=1 Tax=Menopon gallinae TaxID=328185 RepID=A0AAW2HQ12_9NEOP
MWKMDRVWFTSILVLFLMLRSSQERETPARSERDLRGVPVVSLHDLNVAVKVAEDFVSKLQRLEENLAASGIEVQGNSPSYGQLLNSYPTPESRQLGKYALIANRASLYLVQKHCQRSNIPKNVCVQAMTTWNMTNTPLEEKCEEQFGTFKCEESYPYRSYDGSCNHLEHPNWGLSSTAYRRMLPAEYSDGISAPRRSVTRKPLPSSRYISSVLLPDLDKPEKERTLALVQWTQFIGDDLFHTPAAKMIHVDKAIECCREDGKTLTPRYVHPGCQSISIPTDDPDYAPHRTVCMSYVRSLTSLRNDCTFGPADQMNQNTHYLDGSMIYGSNAMKAISLRTMKGGNLMTVSQNGEEFLPITEAPENNCHDKENWICYQSGDLRVNQHPHHTAMYTIWVREHNRIAKELSQINPHWDDETLYQEARKIVIAQIQHITYKNWIPLVLGEKYANSKNIDVHLKGFSTTYDKDVDPRISNSFATVGLRFINSMFQSQLKLYDENRYMNDSLLLKDYFNKPDVIQKPQILERLVRGLGWQSSQKMDAAFIKDLTNYLYKSVENAIGLDVASLDIQRGRDHGLPSYNAFRKFCNLSATNSFDTFLDTMSASNLIKIKRVYSDPNDVDLFVGAILETPRDGSLLGPVFQCIISDQLMRTRNGDRFFYDTKGKYQSFKEGQMRELKKTTLARVICDNFAGIRKMQHDVFRLPSPSNPVLDCDDPLIPKLNLNEWHSSI